MHTNRFGVGWRARSSRLTAALALALAVPALAAPGAFAAMSDPSAATDGVSSVTFSSATLHASVNARGLPTTYVFQYGATSRYGSQTSSAPAGNGTIALPFSGSVSGLQPGTVYHYRVVATNSSGTVDGRDRSFITASIPLTAQITGVPDPVLFGSPFVVEGHLSGTGAANHEVVLQANPFPYLGGLKDVGNAELTNSAGDFSFPLLSLSENTQLRVVTVGRPEIVSPPIVEGVAVRVTLHVRRARRRGYAYLYGQVAPAEVGALVGFQLMRPGRSINEGGTVVKAAGAGFSRFARVVRIRHRGVYRALVQVSDGARVSNFSQPVLIR
jgi:hypothetical protein